MHAYLAVLEFSDCLTDQVALCACACINISNCFSSLNLLHDEDRNAAL